MMSIFGRILKEISPGRIFYTPVMKKPFKIKAVKPNMLVFFVGKKTSINIPRECWDGIPNFLENKGWVKIGSIHDKAQIGTFEEYLDRYGSKGKTHASGGSYVVPVLEYLDIVEVDNRRPSKIRLK